MKYILTIFFFQLIFLLNAQNISKEREISVGQKSKIVLKESKNLEIYFEESFNRALSSLAEKLKLQKDRIVLIDFDEKKNRLLIKLSKGIRQKDLFEIIDEYPLVLKQVVYLDTSQK